MGKIQYYGERHLPRLFSDGIDGNRVGFGSFLKFYESDPVKRYGEKGELNPVLLYSAANEFGYTTGTAVVVDGGTTRV
ncbi:MAG: hypothetical protein LBU81_00700 [Methanosarcinales archaeon]|jgi:NAD(P)-dependent dehydrogenase (short-subunit alcohol dehydrogenase family)|nr:hypothetical protein [Methanosarcinales archaeon]